MDTYRDRPMGRSSGMSEEIKGIRGRAVHSTVRSVGRKGSCKRACRDPFARRTQHLPQAGASPPIPFKQTPSAKRICRGILPRHPLAAAAGGISGAPQKVHQLPPQAAQVHAFRPKIQFFLLPGGWQRASCPPVAGFRRKHQQSDQPNTRGQ
jgi:hypothetical protein